MSNIIECREIKPERSWLLKIETSLLAGKYRVISSSSKNFPDPSLSLTISGSQSLSTMPLPGNFLRFSEQRARNNFLGTVARAVGRSSEISAPTTHQFFPGLGKKVSKSCSLDLRMKLLPSIGIPLLTAR